uniref:Uncharacterized protein n=1 Tax=Parascaris univalens TaxID=6257 RepID=A0A914ZEF9_PARUN
MLTRAYVNFYLAVLKVYVCVRRPLGDLLEDSRVSLRERLREDLRVLTRTFTCEFAKVYLIYVKVYLCAREC